MAAPIRFESVRKKDAERDALRKARSVVLEQAKKDYEKEERRKEDAKERGEDTWMLPSLQSRLDQEQNELESVRSKKKKKKEKKKKKKKEKKKKKKIDSESESDSSSDDSNKEPQWIEKATEQKPATPVIIKGPQLQRDSWMEAPLDFLPTITREDIREKIKKDKEEKEFQKNMLDKPGQHALELNPYWKEGGTGMPKEEKEKKKAASQGLVGDGGLQWMRNAYQRCVQQAEEEKRSLEDVAAEKYGSLKKLQKMLSDAEKANKQVKSAPAMSERKRQFKRPGDSDEESSHRKKSRSRSRSQERYRSSNYPSRRRSRSNSRDKSRRSNRSQRSRSRDRKSDSRKTFMRPRSNSRSPSRERSDSRKTFMRPRSNSRSPERERHRRRRSKSRENESNSSRKQFKKPCSDSDSEQEQTKSPSRSNDRHWSQRSRSRSRDRYRRSRSRDRYKRRRSRSRSRDRSRKSRSRSRDNQSKHVPSWKKREFVNKEKSKNQNTSRQNKSHSSSENDTSSSSEPDSSEEEVTTHRPPSPPPVKLLTEGEMNAIGAKILRAELMGNEDLALKLKSQLEEARASKEQQKSAMPPKQEKKDKGEEEEEEETIVVLTKTNRSGMVKPADNLPDSDSVGDGKRRRKKQRVETHSDKGERQRYFDDDDNHDLKKLVEMEKMGTHESNDKMFAKLYKKGMGLTDEFDMDDAYVDKVAEKKSKTKEEIGNKHKAMGEHLKTQKAMQKCNFCFDNASKHLIIAIGTKVYLSLPAHKSLTDGHCLISPIHHVGSSVSMDEDVFEEIQLFRKALTRLFAAKEETVIFMETFMHQKSLPHMCLECIPIENETGMMGPIYFKKALQESESEWSDNKKVVELKDKNIRRSVPKGFPYFCVDFGLVGGFAHVIEDEKSFPRYFGREIIGGMVDADPSLWRRPFKENFDTQRKKVLQFAEWWKPYDFTQKT